MEAEKIEESVKTLNAELEIYRRAAKKRDKFYERRKAFINALEIAVSCCEKQIPTKPLVQDVTKNGIIPVRCPACKKRIRSSGLWQKPEMWCSKCGQAIDWTEVKTW